MKIKQIIILITGILLSVGIDQFTKWLAFKYLEKGVHYTGIKGILNIVLVENDGAAWGMFRGKLTLFIIVTIIALGIFAYLSKNVDFKSNALFSIALMLLISGTIGNFVDRIINDGKVRDFLEFGFIDFPIFNFADMCMSVGMVMLIIDTIMFDNIFLWKK